MTVVATEIEVRVEEAPSLEALADEWDDLADRAGATPFARPGWIGAWLRAFGADAVPVILAAREDDRLTGVLPLIRARRRLRAPTNSHTPVFDMVAEDDRAASALGVALSARRLKHLELSYLDPAGSLYRAWGRAGGGSRTVTRALMHSPFVSLTGDFESHRASLERRFRKDLDRRRRRLGEFGELTFSFTDGGDDLAATLDMTFELEASGWKLEGGTAIISSPMRVAFYSDVARWARERGWLTVAFACLDGRPIAVDICIEQGGSVYVLKGGYDPEYRKYGLGFLLIEETIARAYANGMDTYELLGDADDYKRHITSQTRDRVQVRAFGRGPAGYARYARYEHVRPLVKRVLAARRG
jgi:CelD/BcsL family acetyltransferase involved in cellulose biosynthesis